MNRYALIAGAVVFIVGCNSSPPPLSAENTVGGASVAGVMQVPMAQATTNLTLDWGSKGKAGQVAIADVLSFNGSEPKIDPPAGWQLIRDDSSKTTRQSLYWHAIQASDSSAATWTFSEPVERERRDRSAGQCLDRLAGGHEQRRHRHQRHTDSQVSCDCQRWRSDS